MLFASGGCGLGNTSSKCEMVRIQFFEQLQEGDKVFVSYRLDNIFEDFKFENELNKELGKLTSIYKADVTMLGQPPLLNFSPRRYSNCTRLGFTCEQGESFSDKYPKYNDVFNVVAANNDVKFLNPFEFLRIDNIKDGQGRLIFADDDHLSVYGARWLFEENKQLFQGVIDD